MSKPKYFFVLLLILMCHTGLFAETGDIPHLRKQLEATQLIVDDKPFLILGGELHNSSASSLDYMKPVWSKLDRLNLNTVLIPVYWELIEPNEGEFDFELVDGLIDKARKELHIH